jgi:hypothetical protein
MKLIINPNSENPYRHRTQWRKPGKKVKTVLIIILKNNGNRF